MYSHLEISDDVPLMSYTYNDNLSYSNENSLDDVFPADIMDNFNQDFECNFDEILNDCSTINANSVDCYFPTDVVQTEYLNVFDDDGVDFSKLSTERSKPKKKPTKAIQRPAQKPLKREIEECKNGFLKPCYPYSCLITLALKNSSNGQLSVSDIYSFVCENFPFFEYANPGWKNSIRHNLSLNKSFLKIEQDKGGARKSCLWEFNPEKLEKVEQELLKYNENDIRKALRNADDYDLIINGEKGIPQAVRKVKTPDFTTESTDNPPKIMKQVVDYFSDTSSNQRSKQTVRQVAEQALNKLLMVKTEAPSRVVQPIPRTVIVPRRANQASTSYDSSNSSSSDSSYSNPKDYPHHDMGFENDDGQDDDIYQDLKFSPEGMSYDIKPNKLEIQSLSKTPPGEESPSSTAMSKNFGNFSLNGNPFRPFRFDKNFTPARPLKRSTNSALRTIGTIKDGQFVSVSPEDDGPLKQQRIDFDYDQSESKENLY